MKLLIGLDVSDLHKKERGKNTKCSDLINYQFVIKANNVFNI